MDITSKMLISVVVMNTFILLSAPMLGIQIPHNPLGGFFNVDVQSVYNQTVGNPSEGNYSQQFATGGISSSDVAGMLFAPFQWAINFVQGLMLFVTAPTTLMVMLGAPSVIVVMFSAFYYPLLVFGFAQFIAGRVF